MERAKIFIKTRGNYMKKIVCVIFAFFMLVGCGESGTAAAVSDKELGARLAETAGLGNGAIIKDMSDIYVASQYGIAPEEIEYGVAYCANDGSADEAVLVRARDTEALKNIETALKERANGITNAWKYNAEESIKAEKRILRTRGLYTVLVISDCTDSKSIGELLSEAG
jgi:hypothetical protein